MGSPLIRLGGNQFKSFYKLEAFKPVLNAYGEPLLDKNGDVIEKPGTRRILADWFPNTLLTSGRNALATQNNWLGCCQVGTDGTLPAIGQTKLIGYVAGTSDIESTSYGAQGSAPYYGWKLRRYRFAVGTTAAILSEVGIGWATTDTNVLITRALIVDIYGVPTTVTPASDEILDVICQFRNYPPLSDATGVVTLNGVDYNYTVRASEVNSDKWGQYLGDTIGVHVNQYWWLAYSDVIGSITQAPFGSSAACDSGGMYNSGYSNNSYQRQVNCPCGPTGWNISGGFRSLVAATKIGNFQTEFSAVTGGGKVPKTSGYTMSMAWMLSWMEATIP